MFSRSGRKTHSDRPGEDEAQEALRPRSPTAEAIKLRPSDWCPAAEAINPNRQNWCPTAEAIKLRPSDWCPAGEGLITPTARLVSSGRRAYHSNRQTGVQREKGLSLQPPDEAEDEGLITPSIRPVLLAKGLITPHRQHPSWATFSVQPGL